MNIKTEDLVFEEWQPKLPIDHIQGVKHYDIQSDIGHSSCFLSWAEIFDHGMELSQNISENEIH